MEESIRWPKKGDNPFLVKSAGDLDIVGGPLSNGILSDYMVTIEIKRFRYLYSPDRDAWVVKNPDSYGRKQARGYSFFGFNKSNSLPVILRF